MDDLVHNGFGRYDVPPLLYHYTSITGFEGIIRDRTFRATAHPDLNDKKELRSVDQTIDEVLDELRQTASELGKDVLDQFKRMYATRHPGDVFTAALRCFTEQRDSPVHWREFTSDGQGVCLGVRTLNDESLPEMVRPGLGLSVVPIEYDPVRWKERIRAGYRDVLEHFEKMAAARAGRYSAVKKRTVVALGEIASLAGVAAKELSYREEKEWRHVIIENPDHDIEWLRSETGKRYRMLPVRSGGRLIYLEEVIVRSSNPAEDVSRVAALLAAAGYGRSADAPMPRVLASGHPL